MVGVQNGCSRNGVTFDVLVCRWRGWAGNGWGRKKAPCVLQEEHSSAMACQSKIEIGQIPAPPGLSWVQGFNCSRSPQPGGDCGAESRLTTPRYSL